MSDSSEERKFLHDLATPLSVALGMLESALDQLSKKSTIEQSDLKSLNERLEKSKNAVRRCVDLLTDRRQILLAQKQNPLD
jgi:hypothetical protein